MVLETIANMNTPVICAIGHVGEELFLKSIADKVAPTPDGLGQYFSEMVERVAEKRNNSRAALVEEVKKQFQKQIEESNKKNQELLKQVENLTKQATEQSKQFKETTEKIQAENKRNIEAQQKKNEEALKLVQKQSKEQMEEANKQNAVLHKQLSEMAQSQKESINKLTQQNIRTNYLLEKERKLSLQLQKQIEGKGYNISLIVVAAIVAAIIGFMIASVF